MKIFDLKALSVGVILYLVGTHVTTGIIGACLHYAGRDIDHIIQVLNGSLIGIVISIPFAFLSSYFSRKLSLTSLYNQGIILGILLMAMNLLVVSFPKGDPTGDIFVWNNSYNFSIIVFSYIGSRFSSWSDERKASKA